MNPCCYSRLFMVWGLLPVHFFTVSLRRCQAMLIPRLCFLSSSKNGCCYTAFFWYLSFFYNFLNYDLCYYFISFLRCVFTHFFGDGSHPRTKLCRVLRSCKVFFYFFFCLCFSCICLFHCSSLFGRSECATRCFEMILLSLAYVFLFVDVFQFFI